MENDPDSRDSNLDDSKASEAESLIEDIDVYIEKQKNVLREMIKINLEKETCIDKKRILSLLSPDKIPQFQSLPLSPPKSPLHKSENLFEDTLKKVPDSAGNLIQPDISPGLMEYFANMKNLMQKTHQVSVEDILPENISDKETQITVTDDMIKTPHHIESDVNIGEGGTCGSKGKEAVNPKYRYKKGRKSISSSESSGVETPVKDSKEVVGTPESKSLESQSPRAGLTRITPAVKRKEPDSTEKDHPQQQSGESCARSLGFSKFPGNRSDEECSQIAKKLKFEDEQKSNKDFPCITAALSRTNYESQQLIPSSSGLSNVTCYLSTSEDTSESARSTITESVSPTESEDVSQSEKGESPVSSVSKNVTHGEIGEASPSSVSESVPQSEKEDSSLEEDSSVSDETSPIEND